MALHLLKTKLSLCNCNARHYPALMDQGTSGSQFASGKSRAARSCAPMWLITLRCVVIVTAKPGFVDAQANILWALMR